MKRSIAKPRAVYHQVVIVLMNMKTLTLILYQIVILTKKILVIQKMMLTLKMQKLVKMDAFTSASVTPPSPSLV